MDIPRRALFPHPRGGLRVTWHEEDDADATPRGAVVLSMWRDDVCVGTASLDAADTARLTEFLTAHLAEAAAAAT